jgi:hypothetical protein
MKWIVVLVAICTLSSGLYAETYTQKGYIKEKGSDTHKGGKLSGVKIKVKNRDAVYFSGKDGSFTLDGLDKVFSFEEITHKDYILVDDEDLVWKRETTSEPIKILMVSPNAFLEEARRYYEPMLEEVKKKNSKLLIDNKQLLEQLKKKSERLAMIDYDELSEIDKAVRECLLKGEFRKADSLILSKGSIEERMRYSTNNILSIVNDFKILSDNALIEYDIDKSIMYLENIVSIDPDNIPVLLELGDIYCRYKSDVASGQVYINQAIFFAKKEKSVSPTSLAESYSFLGISYFCNRNYTECINAIRKCLSLYNIPNVPEIGKNTKMQIDSLNVGNYQMKTRKDSSIVKSVYSASTVIYGLQGNFRLALNINKLVKSLFAGFDDAESFLTQYIADISMEFQVGLYDNVIKQSTELWEVIKDSEYSDNHVILSYFLGASYSEINKIDSSYYYANQIIEYYRNKKKNYYDQYYVGAWLLRTKALCIEQRYDEALRDVGLIESEMDLSSLPYKDYVALIHNNKATAHLGKQEFGKAIPELLKANAILIEMNNAGTPPNTLNVLVNSNLSFAYENLDALIEARHYSYKAFLYAKELYKELGYEHYLFYNIVNQMYLLEVKSNKYKEAMVTAIECYRLLDNEKDVYRKRIDKCYVMAKRSKQYRKQKEYKELVEMYKEFISNESKK